MSGLFSGPGLVSLRFRLADPDAVFVRSILEAYEGLGSFHGDGSGVVTLTAPACREPELRQLVADLMGEGVALTPVADTAVF